MNPRLLKQFLSALGAVALVTGCDLDSKVVQSDDRSAGGSDEIDTRIAVDRTGSPVAAARVALVKAGDSSGTALAVSATGSDGTYPAFVVPDGYYSLLVRDSSGATGRYVDSVRVVSRKLPTGRDTLLSLGSVSGVVRLLSGDSPTSGRLGLVGTDILSSAKSDGTFKIDLVPGGLYTLGAESSLDGYDRIYTRIQLKDGQNLVLPDTLVLPFTGLRVPEGLDAHQDTATGNVRVSWNRVDHPDLMGYVVERVEGGAVTYSQFLTDTTWTDSLGAYWEALPLLGPWPDRNVTYRVRSRSLSGSQDTKSAASVIMANPPEWTEVIDSVRLQLTEDSVGNIELNWEKFVHPDLYGWLVNRFVDNSLICSDTVIGNGWSSEDCGGSTEESHLLSPSRKKVMYELLSLRKSMLGTGGILAKLVHEEGIDDFVNWTDSCFVGDASLMQIGGWALLQKEGERPKISKDGVDWEELPVWMILNRPIRFDVRETKFLNSGVADTGWEIVGTNDSLWLVTGRGTKEEPLKYLSRQSKSSWTRHTEIVSSGRIVHVWGFGKELVFLEALLVDDVYDYYARKIENDNVSDFVLPVFGARLARDQIEWRYVDSLNWQCFYQWGGYVSKGGIVTQWDGSKWNGGASNFLLQEELIDADGVFATSGKFGSSVKFGYFLGENGFILNNPCFEGGSQCGLIDGMAYLNGRLLAVSNLHLWKGELSLPK